MKKQVYFGSPSGIYTSIDTLEKWAMNLKEKYREEAYVIRKEDGSQLIGKQDLLILHLPQGVTLDYQVFRGGDISRARVTLFGRLSDISNLEKSLKEENDKYNKDLDARWMLKDEEEAHRIDRNFMKSKK